MTCRRFYFYDRLLNQLRVLQGTRRPDMKFIYATGAEELYPLLERILPRGSETLSFVDYTPSRIVRRREKLRNLPTRKIPSSLIYTLEDDNVGLLPQLTTGSLCQLTRELVRHGWAGFSTRYWMIGGQDPCVAYLSRAAWHSGVAPDRVYRDQLRVVCGPPCVEDMLTVFQEVENVTRDMEWHELGFAFAAPGMMMKHWTPEPMPDDLLEDRRGYQRASKQRGEPAAKLPPRAEATPITGSAAWNLLWTTSTPWKLSAARPSQTNATIGWKRCGRPKSRWGQRAGRSKPMHASLAISPIVAPSRNSMSLSTVR